MARRGANSSFPSEAGAQLPDRNPPLSYSATPSTQIVQKFGEKNVRYDPFPQVPITTPFYQQYAEVEKFEPVIRIVQNVLEKADGWWFVVAPASKQEYNQVVQIVKYPRRALPQVPEDVPPPLWKHTSEQFSSQMERYSGQFQMEGDFFMYGGQLADEQYENYAQSLLSGMVISLKLKITASVMLAKQNLWTKGIKRDTAKGMLDATEVERESYCALSRRNKGLPIMVNYSKSLSRQQNNFDFNVLVLPYGSLDKMASNNYYTEAFRVGAATALQVLATGGRRLASLVDGMTIYEDAKWSIGGMGNKIEQEPFLHWVMRGGWIYNRGNVECEDDDDPNCKYGIGYTCKGQKNVCVKTLLDLTRESGRYASDGSIDPHTFTVAENAEYLASVCKVQIVQGRLDPMIYRLDNSLVNSDRTKQTFVVATKFGEVDIRYSPMTAIRNHVERMRSYIKSRLDSQDLQHITRLETIKNTLVNTGLPTESQEALIAAVTIANTPDTYTWKSDATSGEGFFQVDFQNLSAFLKVDPFTKAPKELPSVKRLSDLAGNNGALSGLPPAIRGNADKALVVTINGEDCVIMAVKYDDQAETGFGAQRGQKGTVFGYVAVPLSSSLLDVDAWTNFANHGGKAINFDADVNGANTINDPKLVGKDALGKPAESSWVLPEVYAEDKAGSANFGDLQWSLRPTAHVKQAVTNAKAGTITGQQTNFVAGNMAGTAFAGFGQGFQLPVIVQAPDQPYYYGSINGLRYLAERAKNSDYRGWDSNMMKEVQAGVESLDKLIQLLIGVYTQKNMYFDPNLVPYHLSTSDVELNRLNSAICGLFGDYFRPFLARRPLRTKPTSGYWLSPRTFVSWDTPANKSDGMVRAAANALIHDFGLTISANNVAAAVAGGIKRIGNAALLEQTVRTTMFMALLDSGVMYSTVKDIILNSNKWDAFRAAYESSNASVTYADSLKNAAPYVALGPATNYRSFETFYSNELKSLLDNATTEMVSVISASVIGGGDISVATVENASRYLFAFGNVLQWLVLMYLDSDDMNKYTIDMDAIKSKKAQGLDTGIARIGLSKGVDEVNILKRSLIHSVEQAKVTASLTGGADSGGKQTTAQYWVNTGLSISNTAWRRLHDQLDSELKTLNHNLAGTVPSVSADRVFELVRLYNTPIRPMTGLDYSKPVAGDPIKDTYFTLASAGTAAASSVLKVVKASVANMSQAMGKSKNSEWDMNTSRVNVGRKVAPEPSYSQYAGYKTSTSEVEEFVAQLSGSRFEQDSARVGVPVEFLTTDSSVQGGRPSYLVNVPMDSADGNGTVQAQVEPQWMKYRMEKIAEEYKDELFGKMFAKLWCFSPIHFHVVENMINKKITPFGVGYVMLRPFQRDLVGAALFTVAGGEVARSGWNCTIQSAQYNQQHNKVNVKFSSLLGATVLQPDKIMWMVAQVMYGNYSGMGSQMYVEKDSFDHGRILQPEKDGFIVFVGDGLKLEDIPDCISITSQYNQQRYGPVLPNRNILKTGEQHIPGLLWTITRFRLNELTATIWNQRQSFFEEKYGPYTNTDCFLEDCYLWNSQTKSYSQIVRGQWHVSGLSPADSDFLNGSGILGASETSLMNFKG